MFANPQCPEGRQHISLSNYAYSIVMSDSQTFMGTINYSGFINRIVLNSMLESFDELEYEEDERINNEITKYAKPGRKTLITDSEREVISMIAMAHRNYQLASFAQYSKDVPLKIRLNKELHICKLPESANCRRLLNISDSIRTASIHKAENTVSEHRVYSESLN